MSLQILSAILKKDLEILCTIISHKTNKIQNKLLLKR